MSPRDRRWDFLYDRQRQPVKAFILEKLAEALAQDLAAWPPGDLTVDEALPEVQQAAVRTALASRPREEVIRFALARPPPELRTDVSVSALTPAFDNRAMKAAPCPAASACVHSPAMEVA